MTPKQVLIVGDGWNQTYEISSHAITDGTLVCYVNGDFSGAVSGPAMSFEEWWKLKAPYTFSMTMMDAIRFAWYCGRLSMNKTRVAQSDKSALAGGHEESRPHPGTNCPICNGDCAGANPPVLDCPNRQSP